MKKNKKINFTTKDPFYTDKLKEIIRFSDDKKIEIPSLEEFISKKIETAQKLSESSNDPSFYLGKVDALQEVRTELQRILEIANSQYMDFWFDDLHPELAKIRFKDFNIGKNAGGTI
jgi:hypothetical protein